MKKVIKVENLSKTYDLGLVGTGTLYKDLNRVWAKIRRQPDPYVKITEENDRETKGQSGSVFALKNINFSVEKGEVLGIIGNNGAGKSTLLKILSQITSPSTGKITMVGRVASLLEVGTGMHPEMTARQNIFLNGSLMGMRREEIKSKFDKIVSFAGVERYIDTPVKRFSSGMSVRLGFAVAAFLEPEILIVDEVLAVGDAEFQSKAIGKMQDISNSEGRTVLFVSHNMAAVKNLCTRAIIIDKGEVVFQGSSESAVDRYLNNRTKFLNPKSFKNFENQNIKILDFKVLPDNGSIISIDSGILLEIDFFCKTPNIILDLTYELKNSNDIIVFHKGVIITSKNNSRKGKYNIVSIINPHILNAGEYFLKLNFGKSQQVVLFVADEFYKFSVNNISNGSNNNILPGVISPKLKSKIKFTN
ncbi:ABC transporter ATP-binding protein [Flavobacteriales bacterium]|nr:ABC transporter ATP-binding protein [Flavobacteriales bacterium]